MRFFDGEVQQQISEDLSFFPNSITDSWLSLPNAKQNLYVMQGRII